VLCVEVAEHIPSDMTPIFLQNLDKHCRAFALDVMSAALFSSCWGAQQDYSPSNRLAYSLSKMMEGLHWRITDLTDDSWRHDRKSDEFGPYITTVEDWLAAEIQRRHGLQKQPDDILGRLLLGAQLDDWELNQVCMTFLTMGHENVASAISWTLLLLAERQDLQQQARDEVDVVLGQESKVPSYQQLPQLLALTKYFEEAVRMYPSVPGVTRRARVEKNILGYNIPEGTEVVVNIFAVHRSLSSSSSDLATRKSPPAETAWMPFGGGDRVCLGRNLSYMETRVLVAAILKSYVLEIPSREASDEPPQVAAQRLPEDLSTRAVVMVSLRPSEPRVRFVRHCSQHTSRL